ncbi:hypothetical protein B0H14DRAFT_3877723, partial [Mycena olivaceomarginata]
WRNHDLEHGPGRRQIALKSLYPGIAVAGGSEIEKNDNVLDRKKLRAELGYGYLRV